MVSSKAFNDALASAKGRWFYILLSEIVLGVLTTAALYQLEDAHLWLSLAVVALLIIAVTLVFLVARWAYGLLSVPATLHRRQQEKNRIESDLVWIVTLIDQGARLMEAPMRLQSPKEVRQWIEYVELAIGKQYTTLTEFKAAQPVPLSEAPEIPARESWCIVEGKMRALQKSKDRAIERLLGIDPSAELP